MRVIVLVALTVLVGGCEAGDEIADREDSRADGEQEVLEVRRNTAAEIIELLGRVDTLAIGDQKSIDLDAITCTRTFFAKSGHIKSCTFTTADGEEHRSSGVDAAAMLFLLDEADVPSSQQIESASRRVVDVHCERGGGTITKKDTCSMVPVVD